MKNLQIHINVNSEIYLRDPYSSELGRNIVSKGIELISEYGFENFTFKKLGKQIGSPECSIYRYFENKYMLLIYLMSWYWVWIEYELVFATTNIIGKNKKLAEAIHILTRPIMIDNSFSHINEILLEKIIISESLKGYHSKYTGKENKKDYFKVYKRNVVERVSDMIVELNVNFKFPQMLVSTVIEGAHHQRYFTIDTPKNNCIDQENDIISKFYNQLVFKVIA